MQHTQAIRKMVACTIDGLVVMTDGCAAEAAAPKVRVVCHLAHLVVSLALSHVRGQVRKVTQMATAAPLQVFADLEVGPNARILAISY